MFMSKQVCFGARFNVTVLILTIMKCLSVNKGRCGTKRMNAGSKIIFVPSNERCIEDRFYKPCIFFYKHLNYICHVLLQMRENSLK